MEKIPQLIKMGRGKRAIKNTIYMYTRTGVQAIVSLYALKILLANLGVYDYGIYNTIASIVLMSSFVTSSLSAATQRFISYALGENNLVKLYRTIKISKKLHVFLGIIVIAICELVGYIFIYKYMTIDVERKSEAFFVLQFSIITFFINVILIPYRSVLIAYERFDAISITTIVESVNKLIIAWIISYFFIYSRLITYALFFVLISIISFLLIYFYYLRYKPEKIILGTHSDCFLLKNMLSFSWWNFLGGFGQILVNQLTNMFINVCCGPVINAAQGIANQLNSVVSRFVQDFMSAVTPQITKSFSSQDYDYLKKVTYSSIKLSFFLIYSITVPIAFNIDYILSLWLHEVPVYVSGFIKLLMVNSCVVSLTGSISALVEANGNVKYTQICYTIVMILSTCGSYFLLSHKFSPNSIYYMLLFSTVGSMIIRLYFAKRYNLIRLKDFLKVLLSSIFPLCFCYFFIFYIIFEFLSNSQGLEAILISFVISIVFLPLYGYFIFLSSTEKGLINSLLHKKNYDENKTM